MKIISLILTTLISSNLSHACTCRSTSIAEKLDRAEFVFLGETISVDTIKEYDPDLPKGCFRELHLALIIVNKVYKGKISHDTISVMTGAGYGDCGYPFTPGQQSVVYIQQKDFSIIDSTIFPSLEVIVSKRKYLYTDVCSGTTDETKEENHLLENFLSKRRKLPKN